VPLCCSSGDQKALADVAADIKVKYQNREVTTLGCVLGDPDAPQPWPMFTAYAAAKTAVVSFTVKPAIEAARDGIRVNAVAPGAFASGITKAVRSSAESADEAEAITGAEAARRGEYCECKKTALLVAYLRLARVKM